MQEKLSRREALSNAAALGALVAFGGACSRKPVALSCTDTTGLAPADLTVRTSLAYVDASMEPGKTCQSCQQFVAPPAPGSCGSCKSLKGPINPGGYCKSFVAKVS